MWIALSLFGYALVGVVLAAVLAVHRRANPPRLKLSEAIVLVIAWPVGVVIVLTGLANDIEL